MERTFIKHPKELQIFFSKRVKIGIEEMIDKQNRYNPNKKIIVTVKVTEG